MKDVGAVVLLVVAGLLASCTRDPVDDNIKMYSHAWDEIVNKGNMKMFDSAFSPSVIYDNVTTHIEGLAGVKKYFGEYVTGFSNREFKVLEIYGQGERVIKRWSFSGTHTGEFAGMPATGRKIIVEGVTIARIIGGKIAEERDYSDDLGMMQQLGAIPPLGK
jgi:steroid delta-isomerase-like uncharacterized protein